MACKGELQDEAAARAFLYSICLGRSKICTGDRGARDGENDPKSKLCILQPALIWKPATTHPLIGNEPINKAHQCRRCRMATQRVNIQCASGMSAHLEAQQYDGCCIVGDGGLQPATMSGTNSLGRGPPDREPRRPPSHSNSRACVLIIQRCKQLSAAARS